MRRLSLVLVSLVAFPLLAQSEADPFYRQRLDAGKLAYDSGSYFEAVEELRIATFGFLDHPGLLSESLARLAVAQSAAGMTEEALVTLGRFIEVESASERYGSYDLGGGTQAALENLLRTSIPNDRFASIASLRHLHTSEIDRIMRLEGRARTQALEAAREREPGNVRWYVMLARDAIARRSERDARDWIDRGLRVSSSDQDLVEMKVELQIRAGECEQAWATLRGLSSLPLELGERVFLCLADQSRDRLALEVAAALDAAGADFSVAASRARAEIEARQTRPREAESQTLPPIVDQPPPAPERKEPVTEELPPIENQPPPPRSSSAPSREQSPRTVEPQAAPDPAVEIARSRELLRTGKIREAKTLLLSLPDDPAPRELDLAILEAAVLDRDWPLARRQLSRLTPFRRNESATIFYAAVTLYESGRYEDARRLFQAARPNITDSEYVRRYERLIMGE